MSTTSPPDSNAPQTGVEGIHDVVLILTALTLLLRPPDIPFLTPVWMVSAGLVTVVPAFRARAVAWFFLSALVALRLAATWPGADNHHYLLLYWCLGIALALQTGKARTTLAASARWLLGAAFAFAVLWKGVLAPDYMDGRFFRVTLLTDSRFEAAARVLGGLSPEQLAANVALLEPSVAGTSGIKVPNGAIETTRSRWMARLLTWGGVGIEAALALLCFLPRKAFVVVAQHAATLAFCGVTYAFAPVPGFGWLIATMGLAQVSPDETRLRTAYVAAFFLVMAYFYLPWTSVLGAE